MIRIKTAYLVDDAPFGYQFTTGFFGKVIDERTEYSIGKTKENSKVHLEVEYNKDSINLKINSITIECEDLAEYLSSYDISNVIMDSTSLEVPELALLLSALLSNENIQLDIFYVEPRSYKPDERFSPTQSGFELSDEILGFEGTGIPTISQPVSDSHNSKFIFFSGFEEGRMASAFEVFNIQSEQSQIVFGVPAFKPGWENLSFKNNIKTLQDNGIINRIEYCSASCASSALDLLRQHSSARPNGGDQLIYVLPLGTKPCSIGALIFLNECSTARLLFDQPRKKIGRTSGVGRRSIFRVSK